MIQGSVTQSWQEQDYINLEFEKRIGGQYTHTGFNNLTSMPIDSSMISVEVCSNNLPSCFTDIAKHFKFKKFVVAVNKMNPGYVLPFHSDTYNRFRKNFDIAEDVEIHRIIVFLHDPEPGHQLWIEDTMCNGSVGNYFGWTSSIEHMAANLGKVDRYTLQITGTY